MLRVFGVSRKITDIGLEAIGKMVSLVRLGIGSNKAISDEGIKNLISLITLEMIRISNIEGLTDSSLISLSKLPCLTKLIVGYHQFSADSLDQMSLLKNWEVIKD